MRMELMHKGCRWLPQALLSARGGAGESDADATSTPMDRRRNEMGRPAAKGDETARGGGRWGGPWMGGGGRWDGRWQMVGGGIGTHFSASQQKEGREKNYEE